MKNCESPLEVTLDGDICKDSFDRLLNKRSLLRELNILKNNVRQSFNNDSSVEASENTFKLEKNEKRKPSGSISTPISTNKMYGPFHCPLSPISSWRSIHFNQRDAWDSPCKENSIPLEKVSCLRQPPSLTPLSGGEKLSTNESLLIHHSIFKSVPKITINDQEATDHSYTNIVKEKGVPLAKDVNVSVVLPPGKWRRSLTVWKKLNQLKYECSDHNSKTDIIRYSQPIRIHKKLSLLKQQTSCSKTKSSQEELLKVCEQKTILPFSVVYSDSTLRKCRKIGEGTYGEVFLNSNEDGETVLKIIPIEGDIDVNGESQKNFEQILPEVIITNELSNLRQSKSFRTAGFVFLKNVYCLKGKYPDHLLELWNLYEQNYGSENDHPEVFKDNQLYVALELAYGGKDLEGFIFRNSEQAYAAFLQVTTSVAVAERLFQFEHRDLHCGNILIQPTNEKNVEYMVNNNKIQIPTRGITVTIIDYTLSRMYLNKCYYYNNLSKDEELFCAKGDYQYDIYRSMRTKLRNNWKTHDPHTNVLWLHYILTKLIDEVKYKNRKSKQHMLYLERMKKIRDTILNYCSAFEFSNKMSN